MKSKNFAILSILAIVIISGCTDTTSTSGVEFSQTAGVVINDFSLDTAELFEGESTTLNVQIQNVGAKTMDADSQLWIYGPIMDGSNTMVWKAEPFTDLKKTLPTTEFTPPDVARKIPGSIETATVSLTSPILGLAPGMSNPYKFYSRVCYPYSTTAFSNINEVSKNTIRISNPQTSDAITRATAGPVQLKLVTGDTVLTGRKLTLVFEVSNVGGGFSTKPEDCTKKTPDVDQKEADKITLTVTVDGAATTGCTDKEINTRKAGKVVCTYTPPAADSPTTSHSIIATAKYNYYVTKEADITLLSDQ